MIDEDVHFKLGRMESKLDMLLSREVGNSKRISMLERRYWIGLGVGATLLLMLSSPTEKLNAFLRLFL
jgi:hypothetical protein